MSSVVEKIFPADSARPEIIVKGGNLPELVEQAQDALLRDCHPVLFQGSGMLVRIARIAKDKQSRGLTRRAGSLVVMPVEAPWLLERLMVDADWLRIVCEKKADGKEPVFRETRINAPEIVARTLLAKAGEWRFPVLTGILEAPTLRPDGSVVSSDGYDQESGLYLDMGGAAFPPIPERPTKDDAARALTLLCELVKDFPFVAESDRAAALAAMLTALVRRSLPSAPLFGNTAPKMGSGKSLLHDLVNILATGRRCNVMALSDDAREEKKRLLALLIAGDPVVCYDNVDRPLGGAALSQALTQETIQDRYLGVSRMVTASTRTTFLANGNNLEFEGDLTTRVVLCALDPEVEHPEERRFDVNLLEETPRRRGELVVAGLTVLRAFVVAGKPDVGLKPFGRFEAWSNWIRASLVWLGMADPLGGSKRVEERDPVRSGLKSLLTAWYSSFDSAGKTAAEAVAGARFQNEEGLALREALLEVVGEQKGEISTRRLSHYLSKYESRIEGALRIVRADTKAHGGAVRWSVQPNKETVT